MSPKEKDNLKRKKGFLIVASATQYSESIFWFSFRIPFSVVNNTYVYIQYSCSFNAETLERRNFQL